MKQLRYAYMGSKYHKKTSILIFVFFSVSLLTLTLLTSLVSIERLKFQQIRERWNDVQLALRNIKLEGFDAVIKADKQLMESYNRAAIVLLCLFVFFSILIAVLCSHERRKEIESFISLGIGYGHMVFQTILQTLIPILLSFAFVTSLLFLFQSSFARTLTSLNSNYLTDSYPAERIVAGISAEQSDEDSKKQKKEEIINNFNDTSLFLPRQIENDIMRLSKTIPRAAQSFAFLTVIFLACTAVTVFLYSFILYSRN